MLDSVRIRRTQTGPNTAPLDVGQLAETILFYGKTHLNLSRGSLRTLLEQSGPEATLRLVEEGYVEASYSTQNLGVHTRAPVYAPPRHQFTLFVIGGAADDPLHDMRQQWYETCGYSGRNRRLAKRFENAVSLHEYPSVILEDARRQASDVDFMTAASRAILHAYLPTLDLPADLQFYCERIDETDLIVRTNLSDRSVAEALAAAGGSADAFSFAHLLGEVLELCGDLVGSVAPDADMLTSSMQEQLLRLVWAAPPTADQTDQLPRFTDIVLGGRAIADVIRAGERTLDEFFPILDRSRQFREWLRDKPADADLARDYVREVTAETWADGLPAKTLRWIVSSVTGVASPPAGLVAGAVDTFAVDRLARGWRPNQFVNQRLIPFVTQR